MSQITLYFTTTPGNTALHRAGIYEQSPLTQRGNSTQNIRYLCRN